MTVIHADTAIRFSDHAINRYQQRCKPALDRVNAQQDLGQLVPIGRLLTRAPNWLAARQRRNSPVYLEIGDVVPVAAGTNGGLYAVMCLVRGGMSKQARRRRNDQRRARAR